MDKERTQNDEIKPRERLSQWIHKYGPGIAVIISLISAFLAWLPFYYQYIKKCNDLKATILSFTMDHPKGIRYISDVVFINNGNQPCSVVGVEVQFKNINGTKLPYTGTLSTPCTNQSPFTVRPNEVITKQFWMGEGRIEDTKFSGYGNENDRLDFNLAFEIIDSSGGYRKITVPICFKILGEDSYAFQDRLPKIVTLLPSQVEMDFVATWPRRIEE